MIQETASIAMQGDERSREDDLPALMVRYQKGDAEAVEDLVHRLSPRLLRFLAVFEHFQSDAEDLLQECWMRIHRSRHTYRSPKPGPAMGFRDSPAYSPGWLSPRAAARIPRSPGGESAGNGGGHSAGARRRHERV